MINRARPLVTIGLPTYNRANSYLNRPCRAPNNSNFCLQQARRAYFLLLHDDDMIDKDFVEV